MQRPRRPRRPTCTRASAGSCPRSPRGATSSGRAGDPAGAREAGATLDAVERVAVHQARAWSARSWSAFRRDAGVGADACRVGSTTSQGHVASPYLGRGPRSPFLCAAGRAAATRCCSTCKDALVDRARRGRSTTRPARRSTRWRLLGLGYPRRAGGRPARAGGRPHAFDFQAARVPGLDFLLLGPEDGAALRRVRNLGAGRARASSRGPGGELPAGGGRALVGARGGGARDGARGHRGRRRRGCEPELARSPARRSCLRAAPAVHRQRGDDRVDGALRRAAPVSSVPLPLDAYALGGLAPPPLRLSGCLYASG